MCLAGENAAAPDVRPAGLPLRDAVSVRYTPPPEAAAAVTLHVSPRGNDRGSGAPRDPFASLERCRDEIRALKSKGPLPDGGVRVVIHGGEYRVTDTFGLDARDTGTATAPIRYVAAEGERPVFRGGERLKQWRRLKNASDYPLLPEKSRDEMWVSDLNAAGITDVLPLTLGGFSSGRGFKTHPAHELFFNGRALSLARGPNKGFLRIKDVAVHDGTKGYDRQGSMTGSFFYEGDLPGKWADEPDLLLYGYWFWDWADSYERVESIDPKRRLITLQKPWHTYGFSVGAPFYAVNALSELAAPGEWFLDRARNVVLLYPPSDPRKAQVELSVISVPMLKLKDVSHVRFEGLTWELGGADAIHIEGGGHCLLAGCTLRRFAGNAVEIRGGRGHGLLSCDIASFGRGGVVLAAGDRATLTRGDAFVENCDIQDLSRIDRTYTPALLVSGVGNRIAHNRLHDIPSSAMRIDGNDMIVEYNEVFNVVTESEDQGGADMWGDPTFMGNIYRYNYWHDIGNVPRDGRRECGRNGIRLDDAISGNLIHGNIFERCASGNFGAVQIHGGTANTVENNLFIYCEAAVSIQAWDTERWTGYMTRKLDESRSQVDWTLYTARYPALTGLVATPNVNRVRRNASLRCPTFLRNAPPTTEAADNDAVLPPDFTVQAAPSVLTVPGLEPIPVGQIGLYRDAWRK